MPDRTNDMAHSPFAKNRDLYLSCVCTVAEGLLGGSNSMLIWLVIHQLFSGAFELAPPLHISAPPVAVFAALLATYPSGSLPGSL